MYLNLEEVYLLLHTNAPSPSPSTTRRSQGVLAFLQVQLQFNVDEEEGKYTEAQPRCTCPSSESTLHWSLMSTEYNFRALLMRRRQVQRGAAELYLTSYRINNAEESVVDYRVQLQRNVDEEGGKYTEAKPRCTCPLSESTLRQSRLSTPPLLCDFRLVH